MTFTTPVEAKAYILRHDADALEYTRHSKAELVQWVRNRHASAGIIHVVGGPHQMSKDELIRELLDMDYPHGTLNEARTAYYAATMEG